MRNLIINADDFGWDADTVDATIALIDRGVVTSATIMTDMPATTQAMAYAAKASSGASFGLHFNIVDGHTPGGAGTRNLTRADGAFRNSHQQRLAALFGLLSASAIQSELRYQLQTLKDAGVTISHVDSHGHLHKFPSIARAMKPVLAEFGITRMRRSQNLYVRKTALDVIDRIAETATRGMITTDHFVTVPATPSDWLSTVLDLIPQGVTELGVHPGGLEAWRAHEAGPLRSLTRADLAARGFRLQSYDQL